MVSWRIRSASLVKLRGHVSQWKRGGVALGGAEEGADAGAGRVAGGNRGGLEAGGPSMRRSVRLREKVGRRSGLIFPVV